MKAIVYWSMVVLLVIGMEGCSSDTRRLPLNASFSDGWKADSLGCEGRRRELIQEYSVEVESLIGYSKREFIQIFGKPNQSRQRESEGEILYYFVDCGLLEGAKAENTNVLSYDKNASHLIVRINASGEVNAVKCVVP